MGQIIGSFFEAIGDFLGDLINLIWTTLSLNVYRIASWLFNLFMKIATLEVSDTTSGKIGLVYQNITVLLTILMTFYVTFEFVKYVVDPEKISNKDSGVGNVLKRIVISILLLAFTPKFFAIAYDTQNTIIKENVIPRIIMGQHGNMEVSRNYGKVLTAEMLRTFFVFDEDTCNEIDAAGYYTNDKCKRAQKEVENILNDYKANGSTILVLLRSFIESFRLVVQFEGLLALAAGVYICYVLIGYCIDLGTRWAQLLFLQLMAPIAIISYITPKEDSALKKWFKQCLTTYLDVFIRIAIMFFCMLLIGLICTETLNLGFGLMKAFIIVGLMRFVKQAPKMIKELLPTGSAAASIGFNPKESFNTAKKAGAVATTVGGVLARSKLGKRVGGKLANTKLGQGVKEQKNKLATSGVGKAAKAAKEKMQNNKKLKNFASGVSKVGNDVWSDIKAGYAGVTEAAKTGSIKKGQTAVQKSYQRDEKIIENGGTVFGHDVRGTHYQQVKYEMDRDIKDYEMGKQMKDAAEGAIEKTSVLKTLQSAIDGAQDSNTRIKLQAQFNAIKDDIIKNGKDAGQNTIIYDWEGTDGKIHEVRDKKSMDAIKDGIAEKMKNTDPESPEFKKLWETWDTLENAKEGTEITLTGLDGKTHIYDIQTINYSKSESDDKLIDESEIYIEKLLETINKNPHMQKVIGLAENHTLTNEELKAKLSGYVKDLNKEITRIKYQDEDYLRASTNSEDSSK